jgi:RNA polymerase sigma-70 factor, ECF subfamily
MHLEDLDNIHNVLAGDHDRFGPLIDRYKDGLYYHCFRIVQDEDLAEDLVQETFIKAFQELRKYNQQHKFSTWLYTIATRKAIDAYRRRKLWRLDEASLDKLVSTLPSPERQVTYSELRAAVATLRSDYRQVISLYFWGGYSYQEIADLLGAPLGSIKGWMHRAIVQLSQQII